MKIFVTILSCIVLLLSTVPCSAYSRHENCAKEKNCSEESHDCGNECSGKCSPFYTCGTCLGFTNNLNVTFLALKRYLHSEEISQPVWYNQIVISSFICKIWQPPKIA